MENMPSVEYYRSVLKNVQDWDAYLMKESRLPGARSNLELLYACSDLATREMVSRWLNFSPQNAPENTPLCFLVCCGTISMGRFLCEGDFSQMVMLRALASDPRWRVREAVCMALQKFGTMDMPCLLQEMKVWASGTFYEQRAAVAGLCEPVLLGNKMHAAGVLGIMNQVTEKILANNDRKREDFRTLRKALAYCWSVAVAALPEQGKRLMENWYTIADPDIRWIMKQNLQKNRLLKMDSEWVRQSNIQMEKIK